MVDSGLVGWRATENRRLPSVEVAVEMDNGNLTVGTVNGPQEGKDNCVVPAESDDTRVVLAIRRERNKRLASEGVVAERREGRTVEERLVAVLDLLDGVLVVVRSDGNVTAVDDLEAREEGVDLEGDVVAAVESQTTRARTNARRSEPGTGTVRGTGILRDNIRDRHQHMNKKVLGGDVRTVRQGTQCRTARPCLCPGIVPMGAWRRS